MSFTAWSLRSVVWFSSRSLRVRDVVSGSEDATIRLYWGSLTLPAATGDDRSGLSRSAGPRFGGCVSVSQPTGRDDHAQLPADNLANMDVAFAQQFARRWVEAWNAHDLHAVLSHFSDDAEFHSPVAAQLLPETQGVLRGKEAIRGYWAVGLEKIPDLHFEVVNVYTGIDTIVINYRNHAGGLVNEVLRFNDEGLVERGDGTYLVADAAAASGA